MYRRVPSMCKRLSKGPFFARETRPKPDLALIHRYAYRPGVIPDAEAVEHVIEVADSSLTYDRDVKGPLYAKAGIEEYWLVDIENRCLLVYSEPGERGDNNRRTHRPDEEIAPSAFPDCSVLIADLF